MPGTGIQNQEFKRRLGNIGFNDWIKLSKEKGLLIVKNNNGSHYTNIRDPKMPDSRSVQGLITTLTPNCFKQANEQIFKKFLKYGIPEDDIWKSFGFK
jgi:hypothetical protein